MRRRDVLATAAIGCTATAGCVSMGSERSEPEEPLSEADYTGESGWPMAGRDAANTASAPVEGASELLDADVLYRPDVDAAQPLTRRTSIVGTAPAVLDGTVYLGGGAIDASDGSVVWRADVGRPGPTPALAHGHAFLTGEDQTVAVSLDSGDVRWTYPGGSIDVAPVVHGRYVFISAQRYSDGLVAVDVDSGTRQWTYPLRLVAFTGAAFAEGTVYVTEADDSKTERGRIVALDADTGEERWQQEIGRTTVGPVATADGPVVGTVDGTLHAFGPDGEIRWAREVLSAHHGFVTGRPALGEERLFVPSNNGRRTRALDLSSGDTVWATETGQTFGTPAVGQSSVYVPAGDDGIVALDRESGAVIGTITDTPVNSDLALTDTGLYWTNHGAVVSVGGG